MSGVSGALRVSGTLVRLVWRVRPESFWCAWNGWCVQWSAAAGSAGGGAEALHGTHQSLSIGAMK